MTNGGDNEAEGEQRMTTVGVVAHREDEVVGYLVVRESWRKD